VKRGRIAYQNAKRGVRAFERAAIWAQNPADGQIYQSFVKYCSKDRSAIQKKAEYTSRLLENYGFNGLCEFFEYVVIYMFDIYDIYR
jgi:hypothetical protein